VTRLVCNAVYIKEKTPDQFLLSAVRIRTLWTVNSTTIAPSTRLSALILDATTRKQSMNSGLNASNQMVWFSLLLIVRPSVCLSHMFLAQQRCILGLWLLHSTNRKKPCAWQWRIATRVQGTLARPDQGRLRDSCKSEHLAGRWEAFRVSKVDMQ